MWRLVLIISLLCWSSEGSVTCKDENGAHVDWFILYKAPKETKKQPPTTGLEYMYIHPAGRQKKVTSRRNTKPIDSVHGILVNTLRPLFANRMGQNFGFISYNDQPPEGSAGHTFGHSKGIVMMDKTSTGVWLLHSTPQFPYKREDTCFWPLSGTRNGQTFICVTFNYDKFQHIGKHLQYIRAYPFDHHIPDSFHQELKDVVNKVTVDPVPHFQVLTSHEGQDFQSIAKIQLKEQKKQKKDTAEPTVDEVGDADLYVNISKAVGSDVDVQSWGCQDGYVSSPWVIDGKTVKNVQCINTALGNWGPKKDHSKWCVTTDQNKPWTCIADVNRAKSQFERRGGALCINNEEVAKIFKTFASLQGCSTPADLVDCDAMDVDQD